MAEQIANGVPPEETQERGCFDFLTKKDEKSDDVVMTDLNAAKEGKEEKHTLMDVLLRTHSHSASSSDEEVEEEGERKKKKKKKGLKEDKVSGEKEGEDGSVPMVKCSDKGNDEVGQPEEKKGFLEKIKEKLPGQQKKGDEETQTPPAAAAEHSPEKKGILDKIKEKLPGNHKNNPNEVDNSTRH